VGHRQTTIEQFTRQATGFADAPAITDAAAMRVLLDAMKVRATDVVLDVACGPGVVAAAIAREGAHVTGVDVTPEMIALARQRCAGEGLTNARFEIGDVEPLAFPDCSFSIVVCRYALHHMLDPVAVAAEMARVCSPGGRVVLADVVVGEDAVVAARFNDAERARDPSHVRALSSPEILDAMRAAGLESRSPAASYRPFDGADGTAGTLRFAGSRGGARAIRARHCHRRHARRGRTPRGGDDPVRVPDRDHRCQPGAC
jgi:SAM-dependent methyltransferase